MRNTLVAALAAMAFSSSALAADHVEAPTATSDPAADISDFYFWYDSTFDRFVAIVNFAGLSVPGDGALYDPDVLYQIHIDRDADQIADVDIELRYGQDDLGNWGIQAKNIPGTGTTQSGPVEEVLTIPGGKLWTGLREDAFRFDFAGFSQTLANCGVNTQPAADLAINGADFFMGTNVTSIIIEMDGPSTLGLNTTSVQAWVTTSRF